MVENNEMISNIDIKIGNTKLQQVKPFSYLERNIMQVNCCIAETEG